MTQPGRMEFNSEAAAAMVKASAAFTDAINKLNAIAAQLSKVAGCGTFPSGGAIQQALIELGQVAAALIGRLKTAVDAITATLKAAGGLIENQEDANKRAVQSAPQSPLIPVAPGSQPLGVPANPNASLGDTYTKMVTGHDAPKSVNRTDGDQAGAFNIDASPEATAALTLDEIVGNLSSADGAFLGTLATQWTQIATGLYNAVALFNGAFQSLLGTPGMWSGDLANTMKNSLTNFTTATNAVADQAHRNGMAVQSWANGIGTTKSAIDGLAASRAPAIAAAPPETQLLVKDNFDRMAREAMDTNYNPAVSTMNGQLVNLSDPKSPVASTPLLLPGMTPRGSDGSNPLATVPISTNRAAANSGGAGGGGGGGGGGGSKTTPPNTLNPGGTATPPPTGAGGPTPTPGPTKAGSGDPASAANAALSKAKGAGGPGSGAASTRSAGLAGAAEKAAAEKAAAQRAAKAAAALGKGGGGGGAGGGAGGAAAAEKALQARAGSMGAAERMAAAEQAAMQNGRPGAPGATGGAPMGGARPGGEGGEGKGHKAARYLNSKANGEEIVGDEQVVAPTVIGGLNLDTTDDRPVRGTGTPQRG